MAGAVLDLTGNERGAGIDRTSGIGQGAFNREQLVVAEWADCRDIPRQVSGRRRQGIERCGERIF
jgi:hypothetical protein